MGGGCVCQFKCKKHLTKNGFYRSKSRDKHVNRFFKKIKKEEKIN